jgi:hypothetical protein
MLVYSQTCYRVKESRRSPNRYLYRFFNHFTGFIEKHGIFSSIPVLRVMVFNKVFIAFSLQVKIKENM